jgi:hypothetical protein
MHAPTTQPSSSDDKLAAVLRVRMFVAPRLDTVIGRNPQTVKILRARSRLPATASDHFLTRNFDHITGIYDRS